VLPLLLVLAACERAAEPIKGSLTVTVTGLPSGPAIVTVTGPSGFSASITSTSTLNNLTAGTYTVAAATVNTGTATYTPSPTTASVSVSTANATAAVNYTLASGNLALTISGLPGGVNGSVTVTGPGSFSQVATATKTWTNIIPGSYTLTANVVISGSTTYGGAPATQTVVVPASLTAMTAAAAYSAMTGQLTVTIGGLPGGLNPSVLVTGPFAYSHPITVSGASVLSALPLGTYTVNTSNVSNATATYTGPAPQNATLAVGALVAAKTVTYAISTGSLTVTITGLPGGVNAAVTVTGPGSFSQLLTATTTINKLTPGTYTITASGVTSGPNSYNPAPSSQTANVVASLVAATASVAYSLGSGLNLTINGMELTQATQSYTDTVPLVANRSGYLRVFVLANQANAVTPQVRVRWYSSGVLVRTDIINAPGASVPTVIDESTLNSSWNLAVPKALIAINLTFLADVDPTGAVAEASESDNNFPVSGVPFAPVVKTANIFTITVVPVKEAKNGATGNVTAGNIDSYLTFTQKIHPIPSYTPTLHAVYTTTNAVDTLLPDDANGMWSTVLFEIAALRSAESAPAGQYYYGVVHPGYGSGVAGEGFVGGPDAIGWDRGSNDQIAAHEIGHNWGRNHSPGCGSGGSSPPYPNSSGNIDAFGLDVAAITLYAPSSYFDVMSYCRPQWTSNFTYIGVMNYRAVNPVIVSGAEAMTTGEPVLLVWGGVRGNEIVLEPAFEITARAQRPEGHGAYTLEGLDANGAPLFSYAFEGYEIADAPGGGRGFAFTIPLRDFDASRLAQLRVAGQGREAKRRGGAATAALRSGGAPASKLLARRLANGHAHVQWDGANYPMAMIRDARTGQVLSFARGGSVSLPVPGSGLIVTVSDGVRSVTESVTPQ
jgi:hypothetical protein